MRKKKGRESIVLRNDQMLCAKKELNDAELGRLYEALRAYSIEGVLPRLECERGEWRVLFDIMRAAQDDAIQKYEETCERNRLSAAQRTQRLAQGAANIIKDNRIKENRIEASALDGQEGATDDASEEINWL